MIKRVQDILIYLIGTLGTTILGFILSVLYSRMFSASEYGHYALVFGVYNLFFQFSTGWINHSILRFDSTEEKSHNQLRTTICIFHIIYSIFFLLVMSGYGVLCCENYIEQQMIIMLGIVFFFEGMILIINVFLRSEGKSKQYSFNIVSNSVLKVCILLVLYWGLNIKSVTVIIISILITQIIQVFYLLFSTHIIKDFNVRQFKGALLIRALKFGIPLMGVSVVYWLLSFSDRYILQLFVDVKYVGIYSYGYQMGTNLFMALTNSIMLGAHPKIIEQWKKNGRKGAEIEITKYLTLFFYIMIPATVGICIIGKEIIRMLCGREYWICWFVFIITCISYMINGLIQFLNKTWELIEKTNQSLKITIMSAILNIVLNFMLIPVGGYNAAAITTLLSFIFYLVYSLKCAERYMKFTVSRLTFLKIVSASFIMGSVVLFVEHNVSGGIGVIFSIILGIIVYFSMMLFQKEEMIVESYAMLVKKKLSK